MMIGIYLAGGIRSSPAEQRYDREWRRYVRERLTQEFPNEVAIYDPMKGESLDSKSTWWLFERFKLTPNTILHKDFITISRADIVFMNLTTFCEGKITYDFKSKGSVEGASGELMGGHPNIGTLIEAGIAITMRKLLIVVTPDSYLAKHPMLFAGATTIVPSIDDGIEFAEGLIRTVLGK